MDTCTQPAKPKRRYRTLQEKRRIVEEVLAKGASVARVARTHGINANLVFNWRKLYLAGRLGGGGAIKLLPVNVSESPPSPMTSPSGERPARLPGRARFTLNCGRRRCASRAAPIRFYCGCCWSVCGHDRAANEHAGLDCSGRNRSAARFHRVECAGANQVGTEAVFGACVRVSRPAGRSDQSFVVRWGWVVSICEAAGERTIRVAASDERDGFVDASTVIHAAGRH